MFPPSRRPVFGFTKRSRAGDPPLARHPALDPVGQLVRVAEGVFGSSFFTDFVPE